jgi:hypothetical protein
MFWSCVIILNDFFYQIRGNTNLIQALFLFLFLFWKHVLFLDM